MSVTQRISNNHHVPQSSPVQAQKPAKKGNKKVRRAKVARPNAPSPMKKEALPKTRPVGLQERGLVKQQNYRPNNAVYRQNQKQPVRVDENGVRYTNAKAKPVKCNKTQARKKLQKPGQYQDLQIIGQKIKLNPGSDQAEKKIAVKKAISKAITTKPCSLDEALNIVREKAISKAITTKPCSLDEALNIVREEAPKQRTRAKWDEADRHPNYAEKEEAPKQRTRAKWDKPDGKARKKWSKLKQNLDLACDHKKEKSLPQQKVSNKAKAKAKAPQPCQKARQSEIVDLLNKCLKKLKERAPNIYNNATREH